MFDLSELLKRFTQLNYEKILTRHGDLPVVSSIRIFPTKESLSTFDRAAASPYVLRGNTRLVSKAVIIPSGANGTYFYEDYYTRSLRAIVLPVGRVEFISRSPLYLNATYGDLAGAALNINYILIEPIEDLP